MRKSILLSACLMACAALAVADDKDKKEDKTKSEPTITVTNLTVTRKLDPKLFAFAYSDSTNVTLLVRYPRKQLLGVDLSSELKTLKDDKGNSLIDEKGFGFKASFGAYPTIAKDRSAMLVYVNAYNKVPGKGATKVHLKGDLVVLSGTDEKSEEVKKFEFKDKEEAKAGGFKLKVTQEKDFGNQGATFSLISTTKDVKGVVVKDADGKDVETFSGMTFPSGAKEFTTTFTLMKPLKEGKVTISYFSKSEKVKVPVDLETGIGLGD